MIARYTHDSCTWIDLSEPTPEEVRTLMEEYDIPPQLVGDITSPVPRSGALCVDDVLKVTLDFPLSTSTERELPEEVKFLVTKEALITVRYTDIPALHQFAKEFEVTTTLQKVPQSLKSCHLFSALMHTLYTALSQKLEYIETRLADIEDEIFEGNEKEMVLEISRVSQRLILFRQSLAAHTQALAQARTYLAAHTADATYALDELELAFVSLTEQLTNLAASIVELRETNNSLITTKQNEIMKTLTIMAFVTFPLSLLTSLFGMNTETLPIVGVAGDFWYILSGMIIATIGFFVFFKHKRWM